MARCCRMCRNIRPSGGLRRMRSQMTNLQTVSGWLGRVLRLDFSAFGEIRQDRYATTPAILVVLGASVLAGLGSWLWGLQFKGIDHTEVLVKSLLLGSIIQTAAWFLWVYLVYQVLARGYHLRLDFAELTRVMGFAFAPVALSLLVAIQSLAVPFGVIAFGMALLFTNVAIQSASDAEVRESMLANLTGFASFAIVMGVCANIAEVGTLGGLAPGIFFFSLDL